MELYCHRGWMLTKEMLGELEEQWAKSNSPEDDLFYYHPSEDKIVLSHALFWVMTQNIKGKVLKFRK